jgi:hypothetical protein
MRQPEQARGPGGEAAPSSWEGAAAARRYLHTHIPSALLYEMSLTA